MAELLVEIGAVIIVATLLAYVVRMLRQPMVLGYIAAGMLIGPAAAGLVKSTETIAVLSELGIAFLLFIVGLEMDFNKVKGLGMKTAAMGGGQALFTGVAGYFIAAMLGFSTIAAFYIAVALTMSSTMIVIKLLSDKKTLDTPHGRLILGMLLVQDVIAIFVLALLPNIGHASVQLVASSIAKGILIFIVAAAAAKFLIPRLFRVSASSTELLFLSAVSWLFAFAFFAEQLGYSIAIGSFLAGVSLASSQYRLEITSRVRALRDFFATIFFVSLGMQLAAPSLGSAIVPAIAFSLFVIIGNPIIVALIGLMLGYNNRISIMSGLPIGQISEFSLIIMALGVSLGHVSGEVALTMIAVAAITITTTTYVVKYDERIYEAARKLLKFRAIRHEQAKAKRKHDIVLCGYNRLGYGIARKLKQLGKNFVVVDFDPDAISRLKKEKIPHIYGDIGNVEFLRELNLGEAILVISTASGVTDNKLLVEEAGKGNAATIVTSHQIDNALKLYEAGASYVILPHYIGGEHMAALLEKLEDPAERSQHKFSHMRELHHRRTSGYEHLS